MKEKYFKVTVKLKEVYEGTFVVRATSAKRAKEKVDNDTKNGVGYVYDRVSDNCVNRVIYPTVSVPVDEKELPQTIIDDPEDINVI